MINITIGANQCSGPLCWIDQHEALAVWTGSIASLVVAATAVFMVLLQRWLERVGERQRIANCSMLACHHARGALHVIMDYQRDLYERLRSGGELFINRQWAFDLEVALDTVELALRTDIFDPALVADLASVRAWTKIAIDTSRTATFQNEPKPALDRLQASTTAREQADEGLLRMQKVFLADAAYIWPSRHKAALPARLRQSSHQRNPPFRREGTGRMVQGFS
jgi:hypothetical protein